MYTVRPCLIHTCHAVPCHAMNMPFWKRLLKATARERHGDGTVCVNRPLRCLLLAQYGLFIYRRVDIKNYFKKNRRKLTFRTGRWNVNYMKRGPLFVAHTSDTTRCNSLVTPQTGNVKKVIWLPQKHALIRYLRYLIVNKRSSCHILMRAAIRIQVSFKGHLCHLASHFTQFHPRRVGEQWATSDCQSSMFLD
jgi:hypothetical protein